MKALSGCLGFLIGLLPGAFFSCLIAAAVYRAIFPGPVTNSYECARGQFYGWLSILVGALLGGLLLGYVAYKVSGGKGEPDR